MRSTLLVLLACAGFAADPPAPAPKAIPYPLDTCVVTGEKLDAMGGAVAIEKDGREVKFCCKGCIKDFNKDPAKFFAKIDAAVKAKAEAEAKAKPATP